MKTKPTEKNKMKAKIGDIVEVFWMDAKGEIHGDKTDLNSKSVKDLLEKTFTYGVFFKQDKDGVVILQENNSESEGCDYTVIPHTMLKHIKVLKRKKIKEEN